MTRRHGAQACVLVALLAGLHLVSAGTAWAVGPWESPWTLPSRSPQTDRQRACALHDGVIARADRLLRLGRPDSNIAVARFAASHRARTARCFGANSLEMAQLLEREARGLAYATQRPSAEARALYTALIPWHEHLVGMTHSDLSSMLLVKTRLHALSQEADSARLTALRAIGILEAQPVQDSALLARAYSNAGGLLANSGDLMTALPMIEKSVAIRRRMPRLGLDALARSLNNLCAMRLDLGDLSGAEPVCEECLSSYERSLGHDHPSTGDAAANLASVRAQLGDTLSAIELSKWSISARSSSFGPDHFSLGENHMNLGILELRRGAFAAAQMRLREGLRVLDRSMTPASTEVLTALAQLGRSALALKQDALADSCFGVVISRIPALRSSALPSAVAVAFEGRAEVSRRGGHLAEAARDLVTADSLLVAEGGELRLARVSVLSARSRVALARHDQPGALNHARAAFGIEREHVRATIRGLPLEGILRYRDRPMESLQALLAASLAGKDSTLRSTWEAIASMRGIGQREAFARLQQPIAGDDTLGQRLDREYRSAERAADRAIAAAHFDREALARALATAETAGRMLARHLAVDAEDSTTTPRLEEWRAALGPDEALIAIESASAQDASTHHYALVLTARDTMPRAVRLSGGDTLRRTFEQWRAATAAGSGIMARRMAAKLYSSALRPLVRACPGASRLRVVDNEAIPAWPPIAWAEAAGVTRLESLPTVLQLRSEPVARLNEPRAKGNLVAIADPDFGGSQAQESPRIVRSSRGDSITVAFSALPASRAEAASISRTWIGAGGRVQVILGGDATTARFAALAPTADAMHLATHTWEIPPHRLTVRDPGALRRIGLAFADANKASTESPGVLTAAEIAGLRLPREPLVVVASCRSGVGVPVSGEGELGLRSAFLSAGARAVVSSLWDVGDEATAEWMSRFYAHLARDPADVVLAARTASLAMRAAGRHTAADWGAFVVAER